MQEKVTQNCILQRRRLGCQTQRFRRLVDLLGFQPNLPAVSLFYAFHYSQTDKATFRMALSVHIKLTATAENHRHHGQNQKADK